MEKTKAIQLNIEEEEEDCKTDTNDFKTQHIAAVTKTVQNGKRTSRSIEQSPEQTPQSRLIFGKGAKAISQRNIICSTNDTGASEHPYARKKKKPRQFSSQKLPQNRVKCEMQN